MCIQSDAIKIQIFVANRKLNAIGNHVFSGGASSRHAQHAALVIQHRLLTCEVTCLEKLLEKDNLGDMLRSY